MNLTVLAQLNRTKLWRGLWISLPEGAEVDIQIPGPIRPVRKSAYFDGVTVELWRQSSGLAYGAEIDRRLRRQNGERKVTLRSRGNSYWVSSIQSGQWGFTRKIRISPTSMIKAGFSVPVGERYSEETRRKRAMIMSIALRRK